MLNKTHLITEDEAIGLLTELRYEVVGILADVGDKHIVNKMSMVKGDLITFLKKALRLDQFESGSMKDGGFIFGIITKEGIRFAVKPA